MINKKLLIISSLVALISTSSAFAKTDGNYAGVDLLATRIKNQDNDSNRKSELDYGVGFNYKYAFNFNNFFIAPGVFYNLNDAEIKSGDYVSKLKNSYGVKTDVGYDITDKFAGFVGIGYQVNRFGSKDLTNSSDNENYTSEAITYSIGAKYSVLDNVDLGLTYEYVNATNNKEPNSLNPEVIKLGVAYKF